MTFEIKNKYNQHKETIHNFFWRFLQIGAKQGTTFLIFFIAAYYLIPEDLGLFSYIMAVVGLLLIVCDFGFSPSASKYVAELKAKKSKNVNRILFSISIVIIILSTLVSLFVIFIGKYIFEEYILLLYLLPYLFFLPLSSVADGVYRGLKDFKKLSIISVAVAVFTLPLSFFLIKLYGLIGAIISQNILFGLLTIGLFIFRKDIEFKFDRKITSKIVKYALIIGLANIGFFLYTKVDILILKQFGFVVEIGYYEIINKVFNFIVLPFLIVGQVIAPNITKLVVKNKLLLVRNKYKKHLIIFSLIGILISFVLYFTFPLGLKIFLPKYFTSDIILILKLLLLVLPFYITAGVISQGYIIASGNAKYGLLMCPFGILNIILDIIFINLYGFIGVIYGTLLCISLNRILTFYLLYKNFKNEKR